MREELLDTSFNISTFGEDEAGNLYFGDFDNGRIYLLVESEENLPELPQGAIGKPVNSTSRMSGRITGRR